VGHWVAEPPEGTQTVALLVSVPANQHATAVDEKVATKFTLPEKLLTLFMVMTVCFSDARGIAWEVGVSEIVNSEVETESVTVMEWLRVPLVPETVIVKDPVVVDDVDTVSVDVPVPPEVTLTVTGLIEAVGPLGETETARFTELANPARLVTLIVEVADDPGVTARLLGLAEMKKSGCEG
jgi:hypothetical protein